MNNYTKHFIPLESNPDIFTSLIHQLGISGVLSFQEVLSLDDDYIASFERPVLALILIFPTSEAYEDYRSTEDLTRPEFNGIGADGVTWFKQTINNACGLYAILHAICNGDATSFIRESVQSSSFGEA